jgi:hypothetical protein
VAPPDTAEGHAMTASAIEVVGLVVIAVVVFVVMLLSSEKDV